jgi:hypothetical protein
MRKKKPLLIGIAIGALARPVIVRAYRPFRARIQRKLYDVAFEFMQNYDADHPST